jgi:hypothetical protein
MLHQYSELKSKLESVIALTFLRIKIHDHNLRSGIDKKYKVTHIILRIIVDMAWFILNSKSTIFEKNLVLRTKNNIMFIELSKYRITSSLKFKIYFETRNTDNAIRIIKNKLVNLVI